MKDIHIGERIAALRSKKGITQEALANHLGVSKSAVPKWESLKTLPDLSLLPTLAIFFDIIINELFHYCPQLTRPQINKILFRFVLRFHSETVG